MLRQRKPCKSCRSSYATTHWAYPLLGWNLEQTWPKFRQKWVFIITLFPSLMHLSSEILSWILGHSWICQAKSRRHVAIIQNAWGMGADEEHKDGYLHACCCSLPLRQQCPECHICRWSPSLSRTCQDSQKPDLPDMTYHYLCKVCLHGTTFPKCMYSSPLSILLQLTRPGLGSPPLWNPELSYKWEDVFWQVEQNCQGFLRW